MNLDNFYFNQEPNPVTYERCNPRNLSNQYNVSSREVFYNTEANNNSDSKDDKGILNLYLPLWIEITIFSIVGIAGIIGLIFLIRYLDGKRIDRQINSHSFRNKNNSYTNNKYNNNKLF